MKAAWDWYMPRETEEDDRRLVDFAAELGFDTLIIHRPTETVARRCRERGVRLVAVVSPVADDDFIFRVPEALQVMLPAESKIETAVQHDSGDRYQQRAHHWYPLIQPGTLPCYEHTVSREYIADKIDAALQLADGIALDGFGFKNHYACYCTRCEELRRARAKSNPQKSELEILADVARKSLIDLSDFIYSHAKSRKPECLVTNHVWPPFNPDPYYARDLKLDFCTQTISWFYRPHLSLEMVESEAREHLRLERRERNRFAPFIGLFWNEPYHRRTPQRVEDELKIALDVGKGNLAFCTLEGPWKDAKIARVLQTVLQRDSR